MLCQYHYETVVHKVDGPNKGQDQSTKWTDPIRDKLIQVHKVDGPYKSIKWTDPTKGQNQSTKWTDPTRVKLTQIHEVDGPNQVTKLN